MMCNELCHQLVNLTRDSITCLRLGLKNLVFPNSKSSNTTIFKPWRGATVLTSDFTIPFHIFRFQLLVSSNNT